MAESYLAHHGVKGMKWGIRRYQNPDGTRTAMGKKRYSSDNSGDKPAKKGLSQKQKTAIKIGVAIAAAGIAAYGGYKLSKHIDSEALKVASSIGEKRGKEFSDDVSKTIHGLGEGRSTAEKAARGHVENMGRIVSKEVTKTLSSQSKPKKVKMLYDHKHKAVKVDNASREIVKDLIADSDLNSLSIGYLYEDESELRKEFRSAVSTGTGVYIPSQYRRG